MPGRRIALRDTVNHSMFRGNPLRDFGVPGRVSLALSKPLHLMPEAAVSVSDEMALVEAVRRGERPAMHALYERYRRRVFSLIARIVGAQDAEELTQDVFLRAYRALRTFRGQSALGTWLHRISVNVCLNRVGTKTPPSEPIEEHRHVDTRSESPDDRLLRGERAARVREAVAKLPRKQRATLILRMYHDLSHQEIADIVGSSVGAVKANVFHALQNLKRLIGEDVV